MAYCPPILSNVPVVQKVAGATLNYGFDLAPQPITVPNDPWAPPNQIVPVPWLPAGEAVISLQVTSDGGTPVGQADVQIIDTQITANSAGVPASLLVAWIEGGVAGVTYLITYTWTTNSQPVESTDSRTLKMVVVANR